MTPEQFEGWHVVAADKECFVLATDQVDSRWYELSYCTPTQQLQILKAHQHPTGSKIRSTIYNGKCPDIETFRYLKILLEI